MKLELKISNLGKLKEGTIKIRPLTVLAGENSTGKSFVTKSLYSIFSVINKNVLHLGIANNIQLMNRYLDRFIFSINNKSFLDERKVVNLHKQLKGLLKHLGTIKEESIDLYIDGVASYASDVDRFIEEFEKYLQGIERKPNKKNSVIKVVLSLKNSFALLREKFNKSSDSYANLLGVNFTDEIKNNFQIVNLKELISLDAKRFNISTDGLNISFHGNNISFSLQAKFIDKVANLSRVVFFESPTYWRVKDALLDAKNNLSHPTDLTGVPKYFYDLEKALRTKSKNVLAQELLTLSDELKKELDGEFVFEGNNLSFKQTDGTYIDKNLISFGTTNLGMVQTLLKNNIITKGCFVFFDEPETNLHPKWQVLLAKTLIELAKNEINIVIATHSVDMIKALDVEVKDKELIAINYFKSGSIVAGAKTQDILDDLSSKYYELYMKSL